MNPNLAYRASLTIGTDKEELYQLSNLVFLEPSADPCQERWIYNNNSEASYLFKGYSAMKNGMS